MELKIFTDQQDWINAILQEINAMPANSVVALAGGNTPLPIYQQITNFEPTYILTDERADGSNAKLLPNIKFLPPTLETKLPSVDLLVLGMGEDGHYASHFANTKIVQEGEFYDQVEVPSNSHPHRITLNQKTLAKFKRKILVITGQPKLDLLEKLPSSHFIVKNQFTVYSLST
jgi:6-phosphogluconolactonase/glucosamine-6-phosphate isomerase/deaminase